MSTKYNLDKKRSRFTVKVTASGVLKGFGHSPTIAIRDFSGTLDFNPKKPEQSCFEMTVKADLLEVTDDIKKKDKQEIEEQMRDEVLEVGSYPEITFKSTGISDEVNLSDDFTLKQTDYDIKRVKALAGALKVKDKLEFTFDIKGNS